MYQNENSAFVYLFFNVILFEYASNRLINFAFLVIPALRIYNSPVILDEKRKET
jgi:hypothetical protein